MAAGKAILIERNNRNSACALADTGKELQRVSIIQNHPCREASEVQEHENNIAAFPESILAKIAAYATDIKRPNRLDEDKAFNCAKMGAESYEITYTGKDTRFLKRNPGNTIENILNGNQNLINGQRLGG